MEVYRHLQRVCTESCLWAKDPLPHRGIKPASAACQSDALPTELNPHINICTNITDVTSKSSSPTTTTTAVPLTLSNEAVGIVGARFGGKVLVTCA